MTRSRLPRKVAASATALVAALALAACSTKAADSGGGGGGGTLKTDFGVTADTITLGVIGDTSGPFKNLGTGLVQGNQLWADEVNAKGGICKRQIKLEVGDSGYKADAAKTLYQSQQPKILGFLQLLGSPINSALKGNLVTDKVTSLALSWSSLILDNPYEIIPGTTYDIEMINGLSYLQKQGLIAEGDTLGHIYIGGEYGDNGLAGSQYYAQKHNMKIAPVKVASSDTDMTNIVTGFRGAGVKAILVTTSPTQTASALNANAALGLNVPVLGNNPTFDPAVNLAGPAAAAAGKLSVVASSVTFSSSVPKAQEVATAWKAKYPSASPNAGIPYGYAGGLIWGQILQKACDSGDMTRTGVHAAFTGASSITTEKLTAELDFAKPGSPATREVYVAQPDPSQAGGLKQVGELFVSDDAKSYKAPHQTS